MRLLVTRARPDGERTAAALRARGCDVLLGPLTEIELLAVDPGAGRWDALVLTSPHAAHALAQNRGRWQGLPVYTVGRRTAAAARDCGIADVTSADGALGDLVALLRDRAAGTRLLYLAGADRSGDLAAGLATARIAVDTVVVYRAVQLTRLPVEVATALAAGRIDGVLHYSKRAAEAYLACAAAAGLTAPALQPRQFCLSERVAVALTAAGAGAVSVARNPDEAALIALATGGAC
jgi:uroporphyrinogen-III synthase